MGSERATIIIGGAIILIVVVNLGLVVGLLRSNPADGVRKWLGAARRLGDPWAEEDEALRQLRQRVTAMKSEAEEEAGEDDG
jgi:hypothetical protein